LRDHWEELEGFLFASVLLFKIKKKRGNFTQMFSARNSVARVILTFLLNSPLKAGPKPTNQQNCLKIPESQSDRKDSQDQDRDVG
jgi:hypothetical protein